jgi:hypothetical protein
LRLVSNRVFDCPQCGAPVKFQSSIAVFAVCESCRSMVVRRGVNVETMGVMAELPPDLSPLQLGTRGEWQGQAFELVGRVRMSWEAGSWTEWHALFAGGKAGWVAEAQGFFAISFEADATGLPTAPDAYVAGRPLDYGGKRWKIVDMKTAECLGGEGELPFVAEPGRRRVGVDLMDGTGAFGSIELEESEARFFVGSYARFDELHFTNLRPVPGWSAEADPTRNRTIALNCPGCGAPVNLRAAGQTMSAVCGSCGAVIDTANPQWTLIQQADKRVKKLQLLLPIGTRGRFRGVDWEVIGYAERKDPYAKWVEYLLFNPWQGFTWLVTYRGHWSFVTRLLEVPAVNGPARLRDGRTFALFAKADASVTAVLGEFYWKVARGERATLSDYIRPPFILSREQYPDLAEETWSLGEYVEPEEVATAFAIEKLPTRAGLYLNQPNPHNESWATLKKPFLAILALYLGIQIFFALAGGATPVTQVQEIFHRAPAGALEDDPSRVVVTPHFELKGRQQPVIITANAPVNNQWIGFDLRLVNAKTEETYPASISVEYYHGYEDGSSWAEGSQSDDTKIPAVPPGEYYLTIDADADPPIAELPYNVTVKRGGLFWSNFWLGLVALLIWPVRVWFRKIGFESARWAESDFTPTGGRNE